MNKVRALLGKYSKAVAPMLNVIAQPSVLHGLHGNALVVVECVLAVATAVGVISAPANKAP